MGKLRLPSQQMRSAHFYSCGDKAYVMDTSRCKEHIKKTDGEGDEVVSFVLCSLYDSLIIVPSITLLSVTLFEHMIFLCTQVDRCR